MTRRAARVDDNQRSIVDALRKAGATVQHLHNVAGGCPDIAVGFRGVTYLFEIKDGTKLPSERKLTPSQKTWHGEWKGHAAIVCTDEEALREIGVLPCP